MDLIVQEYGAFIAKHQRRLRVLKERERLQEVPLLHLAQVIISGKGVSISSDAIRACNDEGIPIHFVSTSGTPYGSLYSAGLTGTVLSLMGPAAPPQRRKSCSTVTGSPRCVVARGRSPARRGDPRPSQRHPAARPDRRPRPPRRQRRAG